MQVSSDIQNVEIYKFYMKKPYTKSHLQLSCTKRTNLKLKVITGTIH